MDYKKGILFGLLFWVLVFFEVSVLIFGLGLSGVAYWIIHCILLTAIVWLIAKYYFQKVKKYKHIDGLYLGLVMIGTAIILDLVITVPLFVNDYSVFFTMDVIAGLTWTVLVCWAYAYLNA